MAAGAAISTCNQTPVKLARLQSDHLCVLDQACGISTQALIITPLIMLSHDKGH